MTQFTPVPPDTVSEHPIPSYLASLARQGAVGLVGWAVGKGIIPEGLQGEVVAALLAAVPVVWGLLRAHLDAKKLNRAIKAPAGSRG